MAEKVITTASPIVAGSATGKTVIVDPVVAKIAGIAAREVPGVFALGGGAARVVGAIREAIGGADLGQGVKVEVGETQVAVDVTIVVAYPEPLQVVAADVRAAVARAIEQLVGMEVAEINVTVSDVHIPGEDDTETEVRVS
ncbi:putative alkaline shock family protein YloU [Microbacteriaceae bacterium SG_E_30_P1]|uniref:Alkaline shock family protein YloU n=1 Tax=Antiquaquibacter oligotrophicus TaxID=2880260 RepID=A0ABT6KJF7_9MICO|nr:Asp23/Gls24 family envelope stress response protein [Antiquaquibacter oligotrophicus]MDH6180120.1 putative alkaline shock family protein YloU [Antiquaquibacter oligotrophicus]UDF14129.1 Asp23/Gls24 family envelope stress response protein [Antiquaquibacter oligotrophicus]